MWVRRMSEFSLTQSCYILAWGRVTVSPGFTRSHSRLLLLSCSVELVIVGAAEENKSLSRFGVLDHYCLRHQITMENATRAGGSAAHSDLRWRVSLATLAQKQAPNRDNVLFSITLVLSGAWRTALPQCKTFQDKYSSVTV